MTVSLDTSQVHALAADITRNADRVRPEAERIIARTGFAVNATMHVLTPVDTGALVNSESVDVDGLSFEAGPEVEYGVYVELGTSEMSPQPYAGPAFDQHVDPAVDAFGDLGERILR